MTVYLPTVATLRSDFGNQIFHANYSASRHLHLQTPKQSQISSDSPSAPRPTAWLAAKRCWFVPPIQFSLCLSPCKYLRYVILAVFPIFLHTVIPSPPCLCSLSTHTPRCRVATDSQLHQQPEPPLSSNTTPIGIHDLGCDVLWSSIPSQCLAQTALRWWPDSVPRTRWNWSRAASPSSPLMARILVPST